MDRIFVWVFLCLFPSMSWATFQYELSICAIFQDEAKYLPEWIEYHRMMGAQHFYLYNNNSRDHYKEVLEPYIRQEIVELIEWPSPKGQDWHPFQTGAYNHCINRTKGVTHWLAVIDIDEFIVPVTHDNLLDLLVPYEGAGGLQIFWQFFGTSGIKNIPDEITLVEALTFKAPKDYNENYNFKTICQPHTVKEFYVHGAAYLHPWFGLFPHWTRGGASQPIHIDIVRIHHYWTRDENYLLNEKIPRRERSYSNNPYSQERIQGILRALNKEQDTTILRFVPALRQRLGKI